MVTSATAIEGGDPVPTPRAGVSLEVTGSLLALVTVLLPVVGGAERLVAFALTDYIPPRLAWVTPLPSLAVGGFTALLAPTVLFLLLFPALRKVAADLLARASLRAQAEAIRPTHAFREAISDIKARRDAWNRAADALTTQAADLRTAVDAARAATPQPPPAVVEGLVKRAATLGTELSSLQAEQHEDSRVYENLRRDVDAASQEAARLLAESHRLTASASWWLRVSRPLVIVLTVLSAAVAVAGWVFLVPLALVPSALVGFFLYPWVAILAFRKHPLTFRRLAPVVATSVLASGLLTGLYHPISVERITVRSVSETTTFTTGTYARVAESAEFLYLVPCAGPRRTVGVPVSDIQAVEFGQRYVDFGHIWDSSAFGTSSGRGRPVLGANVTC